MNIIKRHMALGRLAKLNTERDIIKQYKCTCSGFVLQYEGGCQCRRGKRIKELTKEIDKIIKEL